MSDLRSLFISPPLVPVKPDSHWMQGTPGMPPPRMADILPLIQPCASIDAGTPPTALEIILLKVHELVDELSRLMECVLDCSPIV